MANIAVLKFGGTSVKNVCRIKHVAEIIANTEAEKRLVVVSAMGHTTDYLLNLANECTTEPDARELDLLLSTGEQVSIALLALALKSLGLNAKSFTGAQIGIYTNNAHNNADIEHFDPVRLHKAINHHDVAVIAGFQGISREGEITTLGRGGSDTSAVAVAIASGAPVCEIYTDVDGIFSDDPNVDTNARFFDCLSYEEALALARGGAQVIHPRAVELAQDAGIDIRVRNTFKPDHPGTLICSSRKLQQTEHSCTTFNVAHQLQRSFVEASVA